MKYVLATVVVSGVALADAPSACGQQAAEYEVIQLSEHLYRLTLEVGYTVNVVASVGPDGVLLVDSGREEEAEALKVAVESLGAGSPRIIINTHTHAEHTGGNAIFGDDALIIAHELVRKHMTSGRYLVKEYPENALPELEFKEAISLRFNGEEIRLTMIGGGHSDEDTVVHFTESGYALTGGIIAHLAYPSVDGMYGDVLSYPETVQRVFAILPDDVKFIAGHGGVVTMEEAEQFYEMLVGTTEVVRKGLAEGKDLSTLQEEKVLSQWSEFDGSYTSADKWIEYLVDGMNGESGKKTMVEPLYYTLKEKGADAAIEQYREIRRACHDEYGFDEIAPVFIGEWLCKNGRTGEAVKMLELAVEEYPEGEYIWYIHEHMGNAFRDMGDRENAIKSYKRSLELRPGRASVIAALEELEAG